MDRVVLVLLGLGGERGSPGGRDVPQGPQPGVAARGHGPFAQALVQQADRADRVGLDAEFDVLQAAQFTTVGVDLEDPRALGEQSARAELGGESEAQPQQQDQVGPLVLGDGGQGLDEADLLLGADDRPETFPVGEEGYSRAGGELVQLCPCLGGDEGLADQRDRPLGGVERLDDPVDTGGGGDTGGVDLDAVVLGLVDVDLPHAQDVPGNVEEHRALGLRLRDADRLGDQAGDQLGAGDAVRELGHRGRHGDLVEPGLLVVDLVRLERPGAHDVEDRGSVQMGVGNGGQDVGEAAAGRDDGDSQVSGDARIALGRMAGCSSRGARRRSGAWHPGRPGGCRRYVLRADRRRR